MLTEVKCGNLCYKYGYHIWSDVLLIQVKDDDDDLYAGHPKVTKGQIVNHAIWLSNIGDNHILIRGQMLTEAKCSKVCFMTTSLGLKHHQTTKTVTAP